MDGWATQDSEGKLAEPQQQLGGIYGAQQAYSGWGYQQAYGQYGGYHQQYTAPAGDVFGAPAPAPGGLFGDAPAPVNAPEGGLSAPALVAEGLFDAQSGNEDSLIDPNEEDDLAVLSHELGGDEAAKPAIISTDSKGAVTSCMIDGQDVPFEQCTEEVRSL